MPTWMSVGRNRVREQIKDIASLTIRMATLVLSSPAKIVKTGFDIVNN